jgi:hypothetical protein
LRFTVDFVPDTYVVRLMVEVDEAARPSGWGQAEYGLLLEVTP